MSIESYIESQQRGADDAAFMFAQSPVYPAVRNLYSFSERLSCEVDEADAAIPAGMIDALHALRDAGLVSREGNTWSLTDAGCFWSYNIASLIRASAAN